MDVVGSNSLIKASFVFGYEVFISVVDLVMIAFLHLLPEVEWLQANVKILVRIFKKIFI